MDKSLNELNEIMNEFFSNTVDTSTVSSWTKEANKDGWVLQYPVPGYTKELIDINATSNYIEIKSNIPDNYEGDYNNFLKPFKQKFKTTEDIKFKSLDVKIEHGILTITVKKEEENNIKINFK